MPANDKDIQRQVQILATNLEVLNQKISGGGAKPQMMQDDATKQTLAQLSSKLDQVQNLLRADQSSQQMEKQRQALEVEIGRLSNATKSMDTFTKQELVAASQRLTGLNTNIDAIVKNINEVNQMIPQIISKQTTSMYNVLSDQLKKDTSKMTLFITLFMIATIINSIIVMVALIIAFIKIG
jgi:SMC interacting uncharacterized protein involved in chromosome segregation